MTQSEAFHITLRDFDCNIKSAWKEFHNTKKFTDVILACDDKQIEAHSLVIATYSPVLANILTMNSHKNPLIYLKGVKYSDLVNLIHFMYHGAVDISQEELESFLIVGEDLKIKGLSKEKGNPSVDETEFLKIKGLSQENINHLINKADDLKIKVLSKDIKNTFMNESEDVKNKDVYKDHLNPVYSEIEELPKESKNFFNKNSEEVFTDSQVYDNDMAYNSKKGKIEPNIVYHHDEKNIPETGYEHDKLLKQMDYDTYNTNDASEYYANENDMLHPESKNTDNSEDDKNDSNICTICGKFYSYPYNLKTHIESKHKGIRYTCEKCDYKATTAGNLKKHVMSKHDGIKFQCMHCDYKAAQKQTLKVHITNKHEQ